MRACVRACVASCFYVRVRAALTSRCPPHKTHAKKNHTPQKGDLPQGLQDAYGGPVDARFVADFEYYASALFNAFGDRVKHWMTFNEPWVTAVLSYGLGVFAPGVALGEEGQYKAAHHILLAHAAAVDTYRRRYAPEQGGRVGIALSIIWPEPLSDSAEGVCVCVCVCVGVCVCVCVCVRVRACCARPALR